MWNPFRKKKKNTEAKKTESQTQTQNRVDAIANTLQSEGRIDELENELLLFDEKDLSEKEKESWWHLYGIVAFQNGDDKTALERFSEGYTRFPDSAHIKFSLGQQLLRTGKIDAGFKLFNSCAFPAIPRDYVFAQARYAYLYNRFEEGRDYIKPFFSAYKQIKILDDHFLYMRGLPFFGTYWRYVAVFSVLQNDFDELEKITDYVTNNCQDYDFEHLKNELSAYRSNNPQILLEKLEKQEKSIIQNGYQSGYTSMQVAILKSLKSTTIEEALSAIKAVSFSNNDFPWLEDVKTLAIAEAYNRFDKVDEEKGHVDLFISKQPLLLEPELVLSFYLLSYQEGLKSAIQFAGKDN